MKVKPEKKMMTTESCEDDGWVVAQFEKTCVSSGTGGDRKAAPVPVCVRPRPGRRGGRSHETCGTKCGLHGISGKFQGLGYSHGATHLGMCVGLAP